MSTNLSPEAKLAEKEYMEANTLQDKVMKLERFISLIPKHKATEKMVARLRSRLVKYKSELEEEKRRQKALSKGPSWVIAKDGDAQISLVGTENSGKSLFLIIMTGANAKVGDYPFTTTKPEPGVLDCKGAILQLIDLPSIFPNIRNEAKFGAMLLSQIRAADLILLIIDLSKDPIKQMEILVGELYNGGIRINKERPKIEVKKTGSGGALIVGESKIDATKKEIVDIMNDQGMYNFSLKIEEQMTLSDLVEALDLGIVYIDGLIIATKGDKKGSKENFLLLQNKYGEQFNIYPVSLTEQEGLEDLSEKIFQHLNLIRVYSKEPDGNIAEKPIVLEEGGTIADVAKIIHSRFYEQFKTAKITGPSAKFDGQSVGLNHQVADGDIVEIFAD
jgi:hypothetical protein